MTREFRSFQTRGALYLPTGLALPVVGGREMCGITASARPGRCGVRNDFPPCANVEFDPTTPGAECRGLCRGDLSGRTMWHNLH